MYVIPEKNELPCLTIVQDAENFSNAAVKVLYEGDEEWTDLGTLEKSVNRFALDGTKKALRVRVNWSADAAKTKNLRDRDDRGHRRKVSASAQC